MSDATVMVEVFLPIFGVVFALIGIGIVAELCEIRDELRKRNL